jgi:SAM-dependent methyltransferase
MDSRPGYPRIYRDDPSDSGPAAPPDPRELAARELLRPLSVRPTHHELEPFSRAWFEELEIKRYAPHGVWLQRVLEFTRHAGESLLMLGAGLGSDALQYHRHGVEVTVCAAPGDVPELVRRNFDSRGLTARVVRSAPDLTLPFERGAFDLAYLNLLSTPSTDLPTTVGELYRVLKPGGKVFVLAPARFDVKLWSELLLPYRRWCRSRPADLSEAPRYTKRSLRAVFPRFTESRVAKRHIRRSEVPPVWRWLPTSVLERLIGRVLVLRAFKPISAAMEAVPEAPAA